MHIWSTCKRILIVKYPYGSDADMLSATSEQINTTYAEQSSHVCVKNMQHSDCEIIIVMQNAFRWMNQRTFVSEQYTHGILPAFGGKRTDLVTFALRISLQNVRPVNLQLHPSTKIEAVYKGMHDYASSSIQIVKRC